MLSVKLILPAVGFSSGPLSKSENEIEQPQVNISHTFSKISLNIRKYSFHLLYKTGENMTAQQRQQLKLVKKVRLHILDIQKFDFYFPQISFFLEINSDYFCEASLHVLS